MEPVPDRAPKHADSQAEMHRYANAYSEVQRFIDTQQMAHTPVIYLARKQQSPVGEFEQEGLHDQGISGDALTVLKKYSGK
jgi:hypothetical protein